MSYLKTNIRNRGRDLDPDAIGGAINTYVNQSAGNALATGRMGRFYGGLVMWSINADQSLFSIEGMSVMALAYGVTMVTNLLDGGSGYRIMPINTVALSAMSIYREFAPTVSFNGSNTVIVPMQLTYSTGVSAIIMTQGPSLSSHFLCVGVIVSTPYGTGW